MKVGIISDTHDRIQRTGVAVDCLLERGAELLVHCGDLTGLEILAMCSPLPTYFVFGNHDADTVPLLRNAASEFGATCLGWGGEFEVAGKRLAVVHGHLTSDLAPLRAACPDYLFSGHSHIFGDWSDNGVRRINPGALHRAKQHTVALLDLECGDLECIPIPS